MNLRVDRLKRWQLSLIILSFAVLTGGLLFAGGIVGKRNSISADVTNATWQRVTDQRGSSIDAPTFLMIVHEDDGTLVLRSRDGDLVVRFWTTTESRFGFPGRAPRADMDLAREECDSWPPYNAIIDDEHAEYQCADNDYIERYVAKYSPHGSAVMLARYPEADRARWSNIVARMASSIEQVPRYRR